MLWLCAHLPRLPLEVFPPELWDNPKPAVVSDRHGSRETILAANDAALTAGAAAGMAVGAAHALIAELAVHPRRKETERQTLAALAGWAMQFSSAVTPHPDNQLLLEVGGSLRLFSSVDEVIDQVRDGLHELGHTARIACAPTPAAARLLAGGGHACIIPTLDALHDGLAGLPLRLLELPDAKLDLLSGMGLTVIGDCLRLPRAGLGRRCGPDTLDTLDRLLGRQPDPIEPYQPPPRFQHALPLVVAVTSTEVLLFALQRLLQLLQGFLRGRDGAIRQLRLRLQHEKGPDTLVGLELVEPGRDGNHLRLLLAEKLERLPLRAPVIALGLEAEEILVFDRHERSLFVDDPANSDWPRLVERLRSRLGNDAVGSPRLHADNRPERAWSYGEPGIGPGSEQGDAPPSPQRPVWLLPQPEPLLPDGTGNTTPQGLKLLTIAERIETGWWDGADVARDYYRARDDKGRELWVFQDRKAARQWFLHGIFA